MKYRDDYRKPRRLVTPTLAALSTLGASLLLAAAAGAVGGAVTTLDNQPKGFVPPPPLELQEVLSFTVESLDVSNLTASSVTQFQCTQFSSAPCAPLPGGDLQLGGVDHVAAGVGLRNSGNGTIALRGAPPGARPVAAWLYWGTISRDPTTGGSNRIVFDNHQLVGELIDIAPQPCWDDHSVFAAFRANALPLIEAGINHDYKVEVPIATEVEGFDPWDGPIVHPPYVDGASLIVIYTHPSVPRQSRFYLHEGAHLLVNELTLFHPITTASPDGLVVRHTRIGADGQRQLGLSPAAPFRTSFSTNNEEWLAIRGPGSLVDVHPDWQGADGGPINQLWDTQVTRFKLPAIGADFPASGYWIRYEAAPPANTGFVYDCVGIVAHAMTVR